MALLLGAGLASGCATARPYYSGFYFEAPTVVESDRSGLVIYLDWVIKSERSKHITMITPGTGPQSLYPRDETSPATIDWLPLPVLFATRYMLNPKLKGLELDLIVHTESEGYTPVTAVQEVDGSVRIEMGAPVQTLLPPTLPSREELPLRFGIGAVRDGTRAWQPMELHALEQALTLLSKTERAIIGSIPFVREQRATKASKGMSIDKVWGQYHGQFGETDAREIYLYDSSPGHQTSLFIGEPTHPYPITSMCLLHEIGHAIADYARIWVGHQHELQVAAHNKLVKEWNELRSAGQLSAERAAEMEQRFAVIKEDQAAKEARYTAIHREYERTLGPVHAAYRTARGSDNDPTAYAHTDVEESFAEAFALHKADPAALRRISPSLEAWFAADGHLKALTDTLAEELVPLAQQPVPKYDLPAKGS
jgi:hypothetical protein